jgi:hypothetical protein
MKLLLVLGVLLLVPSVGFYLLVMRGTDSHLTYLAAASLYVGLGLTLYATVMLWAED